MGAIQRIPNARAARLAGILLNRHSRRELADAIDVLLETLDLLDGDPDAEEIDLEDSFLLSEAAVQASEGPGCAVGDAGEPAWIEWTSMRGSQKAGPNLTAGHEDDEDSDPAEDDDEDTGIDDCPHDRDFDEEDSADHNAAFPSYGLDQSEPLPWSPADDLRARRRYRDRIRAERCTRTHVPGPWGGLRFILPDSPPLPPAANLN
ncbi:MAG: hypothetical protein VYD90_11115 [Pseudomonadota bacterium]|nr:hypothetical protein [Pseudomonadota bacterium]